jgi:hypothetical protein
MHKIAAAEHKSTGHIPQENGSVGSRQIQKQFERRAGSINIKERERTKKAAQSTALRYQHGGV